MAMYFIFICYYSICLDCAYFDSFRKRWHTKTNILKCFPQDGGFSEHKAKLYNIAITFDKKLKSTLYQL